MSPLLPLQTQPGQAEARIHLETDGAGILSAACSPIPAVIDTVRCTGCGRCVAACPARLISLEVRGFRKEAALDRPERCDRCGRCGENCPVGAIAA
ncbi:MAG TPA: 4Fe-4S dicluster domain-containing protein [Desulfuromonadaceae bacterium]